jgi:hypothetical protein
MVAGGMVAVWFLTCVSGLYIQDASASAFRVDARTGNKILPASAFGGTQDIRVAVNAKGRYMVDIVGVIEATTLCNRDDSRKAWNRMSVDIQNKIKEDLTEGEGKIFFKCSLKLVSKFCWSAGLAYFFILRVSSACIMRVFTKKDIRTFCPGIRFSVLFHIESV